MSVGRSVSREEVRPKCLRCGYVGDRTFVADKEGVLRDVLNPGLAFDSIGWCARCEASEIVPTEEWPSNA
jgi:hypothetical protein